MKVTDFLRKEAISIPLKGTTKDEILAEMVDVLERIGSISDRDAVVKAIYEREEIMSTGIGHGLAIPHGKAYGVKDLSVSCGVFPKGIDYNALDGQPVYLVVMLVGPEEGATQHVKALARITRLLHQDAFRQRLINASDANDFMKAIMEEETRYSK